MANVVTINRPEVVALIEKGARMMTNGNKTEAVAMAMRELIKKNERTGTLFGAHPGSVVIAEGVDIMQPILEVLLEEESARKIGR